MDTKYIEEEISNLEKQIAAISDLEAKANTFQAELNEVAVKELATFADETLSNEDKTKLLIEQRTLAEVLKNNLQKARAELYAAEDLGVQIGISVNNTLGGFRDALRAAALEKAKADVEALLELQKGESMHFANRARTVNALDRIESLSFVGNNRPTSLRNLPKLRRIFTELLAMA
jgi:hypothetical protein